MSNKKLILFGICLAIMLSSVQPVFSAPFTIKSFGPFGSGSLTKLLDPDYFGPEGIVKDIEFSSEAVSSITQENLSDADIFVYRRPNSNTIPVTTLDEAQIIKNYVDDGGSLIISIDASVNALDSGNLIGSFFGPVSFPESMYSSVAGTASIINNDIAPEITNGPFGDIETLTWYRNATAQIINEGNSTIIDSFGFISVIQPTSTSGSVVFYADSDIFDNTHPYSQNQNWENIVLNTFAYSAHSSRNSNTVPEPASMMLFGAGLLGVAGVFRKKNKS